MNRATNQRLHELDRQLEAVYEAAAKSAALRLERARERLMQFELAPNVPPAFKERALQLHLLRVDRETGLVRNIASDLSRTGELAGRMIRNESLAIFHAGYESGVNVIKANIGNVQIRNSWSMIERNALNALYNGRNTSLGNFPNNPFIGAFEQLQARQIWQRNIIGDRRRGSYFYERALGRLGDNSNIVQRLQHQLGQSLILGESIPKIATRIRAVTQGCRYQAVRIARTETLRALNQGAMISYYQAQEMGIRLKKQWLSTQDDRTRDSHVPMMGEVRNIDEPFSNGLMYPLDPSGEPEETINCRCFAISVL